MAKIEDCPGFETFGEDVRAAREALGLTIKALAEQVYVDPRYLSEIELKPTIPSIPVMLRLVRICRLPIERYFSPDLIGEDSAQRQRISRKVLMCPEEHLPVIEGALDGAIESK
ncbi:helix-turn-helix transcriptional regulator [Oscillospiraceae bacterium 42-9]